LFTQAPGFLFLEALHGFFPSSRTHCSAVTRVHSGLVELAMNSGLPFSALLRSDSHASLVPRHAVTGSV